MKNKKYRYLLSQWASHKSLFYKPDPEKQLKNPNISQTPERRRWEEPTKFHCGSLRSSKKPPCENSTAFQMCLQQCFKNQTGQPTTDPYSISVRPTYRLRSKKQPKFQNPLKLVRKPVTGLQDRTTQLASRDTRGWCVLYHVNFRTKSPCYTHSYSS